MRRRLVHNARRGFRGVLRLGALFDSLLPHFQSKSVVRDGFENMRRRGNRRNVDSWGCLDRGEWQLERWITRWAYFAARAESVQASGNLVAPGIRIWRSG